MLNKKYIYNDNLVKNNKNKLWRDFQNHDSKMMLFGDTTKFFNKKNKKKRNFGFSNLFNVKNIHGKSEYPD